MPSPRALFVQIVSGSLEEYVAARIAQSAIAAAWRAYLARCSFAEARSSAMAGLAEARWAATAVAACWHGRAARIVLADARWAATIIAGFNTTICALMCST